MRGASHPKDVNRTDTELLSRITMRPEVFGGGKPIIRDTRIAVEHVPGLSAAGTASGPFSTGTRIRTGTTSGLACRSHTARRRVHERRPMRKARWDFLSMSVPVADFGGILDRSWPRHRFRPGWERNGRVVETGRRPRCRVETDAQGDRNGARSVHDVVRAAVRGGAERKRDWMCRFASGPRMRPVKPRMNAGENFGAFPAYPATGDDCDGSGEQSVGSQRKRGDRRGGSYSHSIVPGGFEVMS